MQRGDPSAPHILQQGSFMKDMFTEKIPGSGTDTQELAPAENIEAMALVPVTLLLKISEQLVAIQVAQQTLAAKEDRPQVEPGEKWKKEHEASDLRNEIVEHLKLLQPYYLTFVSASAIILFQVLQPGVSPQAACVVSIIGLSIAAKMSAHDSRVGQISYYLHQFLKSCWEITRRILWSGRKATEVEEGTLLEQGIQITEEILREAKKLLPIIPDLNAWANRLMFVSLEMVALGVLVLRSYQDVLQGNLLTIFVWGITFACTLATFLVLRRKRVR